MSADSATSFCSQRTDAMGQQRKNPIVATSFKLPHDGGFKVSLGGVALSSEIIIQPEDPRQPDVQVLFIRSDAYLRSLYPAESNHLVSTDILASHAAVFLAARREGELLGSVALLLLSPEHAEMKRMFVRIEARGAGLGRRLLKALEDVARHRNIRRISLETGIKQPEAIRLYRTSGYRDCPPFGEYKADPLSLFMTKCLEP